MVLEGTNWGCKRVAVVAVVVVEGVERIVAAAVGPGHAPGAAGKWVEVYYSAEVICKTETGNAVGGSSKKR